MSAEEYNTFITDLIDKPDFSYTTTSEKKLSEIKEFFKEEDSFDEISEEFSIIEKKIKGDLNKDLIRYKDEIIPLIENEIVSRYYFQKGKAIHSFSFDPSIQQSLQILKDLEKYNKILNK